MNSDNDQTVYHVNVPAQPTINVKVERNSRGINWEITVVGAENWQQAKEMIEEVEKDLREKYTEQ